MATDDQSSPPPVRASKRDWERVTNNQAWSPALCLLELRDRVEALEAMAQPVAAPEPDPDQILASMNAIYEKLSPAEPAPQTQQGVTVKVPRLFAAPLRRTLSKDGNTCVVDALADDGTCWICQLGVDFSRNHLGETVSTDWQQITPLPDRVAALEAGGGVAGNPGHAPAGVSVDDLADCLPANAWAGPEGYSRQAFARHLLDHPRIGPLLRGEGAAAPKRVVLAEEPPTCLLPGGRRALDLAKLVCLGWAAARAEVERQQQGGRADG